MIGPTQGQPCDGGFGKKNPATLDPIFRPRSIAVIGASTRRGAIGREIVHNLISGDFQGKLFPVNPRAEFIHSIKAYPSILEVPDAVDLAIIVVPAAVVPAVADECGQKGVKGLIVVSAGFKEVGPEGAALELELLEVVRKWEMRMVGPNCLGIFNADDAVRLNATFAPGTPLSGPVGFVSQSGALGIAIWTEMQKLGVGFSQFASIGNKADMTGNDLLAYWEDDAATKVMALYIESFGEPRRFFKLARCITKKKPIIMVKSGRTDAGARAASSHTGALSGLDAATDALIRQTGVIRARTIDDMMALLLGFTRCPIPKGNRVAVLTNAGGPGIMVTDALIGYDMQLADLSEHTKDRLREFLPAEASLGNPVDMIAGATAESFGQCLPILLEAEEVDLVIVTFVPPIMVDPLDVVGAVSAVKRGYDKPVFMILMAEDQYFLDIPRQIPDCPPIYHYPEVAAYTAAEMANYADIAARERGSSPRSTPSATARGIIDMAGQPGSTSTRRRRSVCSRPHFPVAPWRRVYNADDAVAAADELGYPVVLKVAGRKVVHKSDVGGVILGIKSSLEMEGAVGRMSRAMTKLGHDPEEGGFLVQRMAPPGREVILGMSTDAVIGPILLFGLGGKYVEV